MANTHQQILAATCSEHCVHMKEKIMLYALREKNKLRNKN